MTKMAAYGGVVVGDDGRVLLREPRDHYGGYAWTFPKGRPDEGETGEQAALREVLEETGYEARIVRDVPGTFAGFETMTSYYLMSCVRRVGDPDPAETAALAWVTFEEARGLIAQTTYERGRERDLAILEAAERLVHPA